MPPSTPPDASSSDLGRFEIPPHLLWPGMVIGLLVLGVGSGFWLVYSSASDGGVEPVAEYHAVADGPARAAAAQASAALGWTVRATAQGPNVTLAVSDRRGAPVSGLTGRVVVARPQVARALDTLAFVEAPAGTYTVALPAPAPGLWDFAFDATRGPDRFLGTARLTMP